MAADANDFSKGSVPRNILRMAVPMTVAQLINILYNIVDRMYLGRLPGHLALTGLGPVSYTHLDVYKRQTDTCAALGLDFDAVEAAFAPLCTKVATITTAESFGELAQ